MSEKQSLDDLLGILRASDNALIELSDTQLCDVFGDIRDKVDSIKEVLNRMDADELRFRKEEDLFRSKRQAVANGKKRLKEYIAMVMRQQDTPKLMGNNYYVSLRKKKTTKQKDVPFGIINAHVIENKYSSDLVSYKLNASLAKMAFDKFDMEKYFEENETESAVFGVKKS